MQGWADDPQIDVILSTGGTGFAPRDVTPEAIRPLCRRAMDGFAVLFHQASHATVGLSTLQSRAFAGQIGDTFIFCLPGSTGACRDGWDLVLRDELDSRYRPCSLAGLVPRLATWSPHERAQPCRRGRPRAHGRCVRQAGHRANRDRARNADLQVRDTRTSARGNTPKGAVIATAELAGVMGAKRTAELIPLCHPLPLTKVEVRIEIDDALPGFRVQSEVRTHAVTGVEMEALTGVAVACLTLFDMLKASIGRWSSAASKWRRRPAAVPATGPK